ncbi:MAG: methylglyoxal synthase [Ruminococcaceae bacterium]|nr:methylglyoxal synthase [Oscillospiraceae bacterium]
MHIAIMADDKKKELLAQFCIAYCGILSKHYLYATSITGKYVNDATGLNIEKLLPGSQGGGQQILSRIAYDEIDMLIFMRDPDAYQSPEQKEVQDNLLRLCDIHNVPVATNLATAEVLINGLERGDLAWREIVNPNMYRRY